MAPLKIIFTLFIQGRVQSIVLGKRGVSWGLQETQLPRWCLAACSSPRPFLAGTNIWMSQWMLDIWYTAACAFFWTLWCCLGRGGILKVLLQDCSSLFREEWSCCCDVSVGVTPIQGQQSWPRLKVEALSVCVGCSSQSELHVVVPFRSCRHICLDRGPRWLRSIPALDALSSCKPFL